MKCLIWCLFRDNFDNFYYCFNNNSIKFLDSNNLSIMAVSRIDQVQENYQSSSTNHQILAQTDLKTASRSGKTNFY